MTDQHVYQLLWLHQATPRWQDWSPEAQAAGTEALPVSTGRR